MPAKPPSSKLYPTRYVFPHKGYLHDHSDPGLQHQKPLARQVQAERVGYRGTEGSQVVLGQLFLEYRCARLRNRLSRHQKSQVGRIGTGETAYCKAIIR